MSKGKKDQNEISTGDFDKLHQRLKELDNAWIKSIVEQVNAEIKRNPKKYEGMEPCAEIKIYNIFNGVVRNNKWKTLVYGQCLKFIQEKETEITNLKEAAKAIV